MSRGIAGKTRGARSGREPPAGTDDGKLGTSEDAARARANRGAYARHTHCDARARSIRKAGGEVAAGSVDAADSRRR